jgi:hypothetical protein
VHIDPAQAGAGQAVAIDQRHGFFISRDQSGGQRREVFENIAALRERAARQLANHEGMREHVALVEQVFEIGVRASEVVDPDGGVNQHRRSPIGRRTSSRRGRGSRIRAAQRRQAPRDLAGNQRPQRFMNHRRLLGNAGQGLRTDGPKFASGPADTSDNPCEA